MRKELANKLNRLNEAYHKAKMELLKNPETKPEHLRKLAKMREDGEAKLYKVYSDGLQKLNAGEKINIK